MSHEALNPEQFVGYHVTQARYRPSIEEHGLRPSSPYEGPRGVYLHHDLESARRWRSREDDEQDIYEVTLRSGRSLRPDPVLRDQASVYPRGIPARRVRRVVDE